MESWEISLSGSLFILGLLVGFIIPAIQKWRSDSRKIAQVINEGLEKEARRIKGRITVRSITYPGSDNKAFLELINYTTASIKKGR